MTFSAVVPAADLATANAALEGPEDARTEFGPGNFSIPAYDGSGAQPTHAALHAWEMPDFIAAVKELPNVQWSELPGDPKDRIADALSKVGAEWGAQAKPLTGQVTPGLHEDDDGQMWLVIQPFDRSVFTQALADLPALVRRARTPGVAEPWVQPLDGENAYRVLDPWTGAGEVATHEGKTWRVTQGDGAGNNVFKPGVFGWEEVDPVTFEPLVPETEQWVQPTGAEDAYPLDAEVTHTNAQDGGNIWLFRSKINANTTEPGTDGTFHRWWEPVEAVT